MFIEWCVTAYLHMGYLTLFIVHIIKHTRTKKNSATEREHSRLPRNSCLQTFAKISITDSTSFVHFPVRGGGGLTHLTDLPSAETESYFNSECLKPCWKRYFLQYASRTRMAHANAQTLSPPASLPRGSFWLVHLSCQSEPCGRDSNNPLVFPSLWTPQQTKSGADSSKATAFILLPEDNSSWFLRFSVPVQSTGN